MQLGFHGATTMTSDLETDVAITAYAGFKALEVWATKMDQYLTHHALAELNALFADHSITPSAINSIEFIAFRGQDYTRIQARCHELCRIAQAIHCPTIVVVPSPTPDRNLAWADIVTEYVTVLRDLGEIAHRYGIKLSFEFLGFGWCSVRTPRAAFEIVQKTDRDNIGMTIDAAHLFGGGGLLSELDQLDPKRIFAFHLDDLDDTPKEAITDATRLFPGLGVIPLAEICARLKGIGYDGSCSVELFRPEYWSWEPRQVAVKAKATALNVLSPYFKIE